MMGSKFIKNAKVLVTGGAGFIGSNLIDVLLEQGNEVVCLDNFATGKRENLLLAQQNEKFTLIEGDIRNFDDCSNAVQGCEYVLHQAALGSVPRSIADPMTTTDVNIGGFVKMLFAAKEAGVKRFVYAASSSTYGDHAALPKVEHIIGNALSPYAITKYVDELFAKNFSDIYGIETIGLRYFNVFGRRQDPNGAYAAVIPKFVSELMAHRSPIINGDGSFSRDFTYIDNVIQANQLAAITPPDEFKNKLRQYSQSIDKPFYPESTISEVFNVAFGERTTLMALVEILKMTLAKFDSQIGGIEILYGSNRGGDIPHSLASIEKARKILDYQPKYDINRGLIEATNWYYTTLK
jgi:UDP-N-acetylglucosamine/UDP-N-acetylgalactosamine 4-epimerase